MVERLRNGNGWQKVAGRISIIVGVASLVVIVIGGVYRLANEVSTVNAELDRNCRILVTINADVRFQIIEAQQDKATAATYARLFKEAGTEVCG